MGMFDDYNVFPTLKTKTIVIAANGEVTIRGLLSTRESERNKSTWLGTSRFTQYVRICFAIVPKGMESDPEFSRVFSAGTRFVDGPPFRHFRARYKTVSLTLDEVLQNEYASSVGETDLESGLVVNDLFFETTLDMNQNILVPNADGVYENLPGYWGPIEPEEDPWFKQAAGHESWCLVGFLHFDYEQFDEDYIMVEGLKQLGSNCTYDILLEKTTTASGAEFMRPPSSTKAFFYNETWPRGVMHLDVEGDFDAEGRPIGDGKRDIAVKAHVGEPYFGLAYWDDTETYTGWRGGRSSDPEPGPVLSVRQVPYTKVTAHHRGGFPVQGGEDYSANGWFFESYDENTPTINILPNLDLTGGENLKLKVKLLGDQVRKTIKDFRKQSIFKAKVSNSNILFKYTATGIMIPPGGEGSVSEEACHQVVAYLDMSDLLKLYSPLGWLLEYHIRINEITGEEQPASQASATLLENAINFSEIKRLIISRKRLTNDPYGNNASSSPDHMTYDKEEIPKHLVTTADRRHNNGLLLRDVGGIEEGARVTGLGSSGQHRGLYLEDYDLFHNVTYGNYEYSADIHILDGLKYELERRVKTYYLQRERMTEYIAFSNIPAIYENKTAAPPGTREEFVRRLLEGFSRDEHEKGSTVHSGNYDYKINEYTDSFTQAIPIKYGDMINRFVTGFVDCYKVLELSPGPPGEEDQTWLEYRNNLITIFKDPSPGQIDAYINFCDKVVATLENVLGRGNVDKYERTNSGVLSTSLDASKESRIINVQARIPEVVAAISRNQIFVEPGLGQMSWQSRAERGELWNYEEE